MHCGSGVTATGSDATALQDEGNTSMNTTIRTIFLALAVTGALALGACKTTDESTAPAAESAPPASDSSMTPADTTTPAPTDSTTPTEPTTPPAEPTTTP
jgi:hypothetical protein